MMLTVPQAAARVGRGAETIRRWIRSGRLPARKVGTQYAIDEADLEAAVQAERLPLPAAWQQTMNGSPMPNVVAAIRRSRAGR